MDLVSVGTDPAEHLRPVSQRVRTRQSAGQCERLDTGRQPLPALCERPAGAVGSGTLRPAVAGGRPPRPDTVSPGREKRDRLSGPVLRDRRRNLGHGKARTAVQSRRGRPGNTIRQLLVVHAAGELAPGPLQTLVPESLAGGVRRPQTPLRMGDARLHSRHRMAPGTGGQQNGETVVDLQPFVGICLRNIRRPEPLPDQAPERPDAGGVRDASLETHRIDAHQMAPPGRGLFRHDRPGCLRSDPFRHSAADRRQCLRTPAAGGRDRHLADLRIPGTGRRLAPFHNRRPGRDRRGDARARRAQTGDLADHEHPLPFVVALHLPGGQEPFRAVRLRKPPLATTSYPEFRPSGNPLGDRAAQAHVSVEGHA